MQRLLILALALLLAGCGFFGGGRTSVDDAKVEAGDEDAVFDSRTGPNTKRLVKDLRTGLIGDTANARYSSENLRGDDAAGDEDGSGGDGQPR